MRSVRKYGMHARVDRSRRMAPPAEFLTTADRHAIRAHPPGIPLPARRSDAAHKRGGANKRSRPPAERRAALPPRWTSSRSPCTFSTIMCPCPRSALHRERCSSRPEPQAFRRVRRLVTVGLVGNHVCGDRSAGAWRGRGGNPPAPRHWRRDRNPQWSRYTDSRSGARPGADWGV